MEEDEKDSERMERIVLAQYRHQNPEISNQIQAIHQKLQSTMRTLKNRSAKVLSKPKAFVDSTKHKELQ